MATDLKKSIYLNFKDFLGSAEDEFTKGRFNPALSSYFKAIAIICDYKIYDKMSLLPKNHAERSLFLRMHFPDAYSLVSPLFKEYTDSYNLRIQKEAVIKLRDTVGKLKKIFNIEK